MTTELSTRDDMDSAKIFLISLLVHGFENDESCERVFARFLQDLRNTFYKERSTLRAELEQFREENKKLKQAPRSNKLHKENDKLRTQLAHARKVINELETVQHDCIKDFKKYPLKRVPRTELQIAFIMAWSAAMVIMLLLLFFYKP